LAIYCWNESEGSCLITVVIKYDKLLLLLLLLLPLPLLLLLLLQLLLPY
jgi:hypothetical protein